MWRDYAGKHDYVIKRAAQTTIRNCAARVTQDEYLLRREYVQQLIQDALDEKFGMFGLLFFIILLIYGKKEQVTVECC